MKLRILKKKYKKMVLATQKCQKRNIKNVWEETTREAEEENNQGNDKTIGTYKDQGYRSECERVLYTRSDCWH